MTVAVEVLEDPENPPNEIRELPLPGGAAAVRHRLRDGRPGVEGRA